MGSSYRNAEYVARICTTFNGRDACGGRYLTAVKVAETSRQLAFVSVHRSARHGPFETADVRLLKRLQPHLSKAAELFQKFADMRVAQIRSASALDRFATAAMIVDQKGKVLERNARAEAFLRSGEPLTVKNERIETSHAQKTTILHRLIADAAAAAGGTACAPGGIIRLERSSGGVYLMIAVSPLRPASSCIMGMTTSAAILFIADSEAQPVPPAQ